MKVLRATHRSFGFQHTGPKLEKEGIPFYFYKTGDKSAGAILIKVLDFEDEVELYHRINDFNWKTKVG